MSWSDASITLNQFLFNFVHQNHNCIHIHNYNYSYNYIYKHTYSRNIFEPIQLRTTLILFSFWFFTFINKIGEFYFTEIWSSNKGCIGIFEISNVSDTEYKGRINNYVIAIFFKSINISFKFFEDNNSVGWRNCSWE